MSNYGYTKKLDCDFSTAVEKLRKALKEQGFGILTEIDVKVAMKEKLDKDMEDYVILGACNPSLASQALDFEKEIGLLLPCNVIAYKQGDDVFVSAILPSVAMSFVGNDSLQKIAKQAEPKLISAIDNT
ncbi:MAG: DUF302 domain-containing protein [Nitrospirae bacterium]|nr:DUF302 domain-containing protein [Nitrospirota bacterium]